MSDAEVDAEAAALRFTLDEQPVDRVQLPGQIDAEGPDWRVVAQAGPGVVTHVVEVEVPGAGPHVSAVEEQHSSEISEQRDTELGRKIREREAANRQARSAEGRHLEPPPPAQVRRAAQEVPLVERHLLFGRSP